MNLTNCVNIRATKCYQGVFMSGKTLDLVLRNKANEIHQWHGRYKHKISATHSFWWNIFNNEAIRFQT